MARIRSIHAPQWNDDDFIECSPFARLLVIALRNFADDQGVFEWKPKQLKRSCLPGDACDVVPLLKELEDHNQVKRYTIDGREYGAIRNFRRWQRPKSPNSTYPVTEEIRKYVALTVGDFGNRNRSDGEISEIEGDDDGVISEPLPKNTEQMEEVGGRREEVGGEETSSLRSDEISPASLPGFEETEPPPKQKTQRTPRKMNGHLETDAAFDAYDAAAEANGWAACQARSELRKGHLRKRLEESGGIEGWKTALEKASQSDFCMGRSPPTDGHSQFRMHIDFLLEQRTFIRLMEGRYDNRSGGQKQAGDSGVLASAARVAARRAAGGAYR